MCHVQGYHYVLHLCPQSSCVLSQPSDMSALILHAAKQEVSVAAYCYVFAVKSVSQFRDMVAESGRQGIYANECFVTFCVSQQHLLDVQVKQSHARA